MGVLLISLGLLMQPTATPDEPKQQPAAKPKAELPQYSYQGTVKEVTDKSITIDDRGLGAKMFPVSGPLAKGKHPAEDLGFGYTYRLSDVCVGDKVAIFCSVTDGVCTHICINRRPGGKIPPAPGEPADIVFKYHELVQTRQDWEEKGTPIPGKYHPGGNVKGIAPMPREAIPRIAPATP